VAEEAQAGPTQEELLEALERLTVGDLLAQSLVSIVSLAYAKLEPSRRDLEQVRLAVEALRALVPVLEGAADEALLRDLESARANLQLAYARAVDEERADGGDGDG
jgi:hypothetical protein